jgi:acetoin utilization deacetylase AcuC-like enzyme
MRKTAIFRNNLFLAHDPGSTHIESPGRIKKIYEKLDNNENRKFFCEPEFFPVSEKELLLNHSENLVKQVAATSGKVYSILDADTCTSKESYNAACLAVGAVLKAVDLLFTESIDNGFALVRPPGHHAERNRSMGFCLFNNIAVAAQYALKKYKVRKIFIVDWDVHHGNGTQNAFYETDEVFYLSIHQYPLYPGTGSLRETGSGKGKGYTLNIPLPGGQGDLEYANIFNSVVKPVCREYKPELILVSAGFDSFINDGISAMRLTGNGFAYMTRVLVDLAEDICEGRLFLSLEGGYNFSGMEEGVFAVLGELAGIAEENGLDFGRDETIISTLAEENGLHPAIEMAREVAKKYWKM